MSIYANLGVPKVWRFHQVELAFYILGDNGEFEKSPMSRAFTSITSTDLAPYVAQCGQVESNTLFREFRKWIRSRK